MNKKIKSLVLAAVMGLSLTTVAVVPTTVEAASAGAAETLIGGAVAYAYVSTAFNKMDNSKEGQEQSLARAKKQTGYLEDSAAQARVQRIMKTLELRLALSVRMWCTQILVMSSMHSLRLVA